MNSGRILLPFLFVAVFGFVAWRECTDGILKKVEQGYSHHAALAVGLYLPTPEIVLVFQSAGEDLTTLDCALFLRAAGRLGVKNAGIAAMTLREDDPSVLRNLLQDPHRLPARVLLPSVLSSSPESSGVLPSPIPAQTDPGLPVFASSLSPFPPVRTVKAGFVNLPADPGETFVAARLRETVVPSFALAALTDRHSPALQGDSVVFSRGLVLPLQRGGTVALLPGQLRQLPRVELDDLLIDAEKAAQDLQTSFTVTPHTFLLLGTLAPDPVTGEIRLREGRKLSAAEYQAAAILSLHQQIQTQTAGWMGLLAVLLSASLAGLLKSLYPDYRWTLLLLVASGYLLATLCITAATGMILPGIPLLSSLLLVALLPFPALQKT
jgi:hypothetical protein